MDQLNDYCNSTFWNSSLSWDTNSPDLTYCFERTVLVWIPAIFLWIFAPVEFYYLKTSKNPPIPWNFFDITKLSILTSLVVLSLGSIGYHMVYDYKIKMVDIFTPLIEIGCYTLVAFFVNENRRKGLKTSGLQFIFWLLLTVCGFFQVRSLFFEKNEQFFTASYLAHYFLVVSMLVLSCFVNYSNVYKERQKKLCPEESSSFLSRILFSWFTPFAWKGFKHVLDSTDCWNLRNEDLSKEIFPIFDSHWNNELKKKPYGKCSILMPLIKSFGLSLLFGAFLKFVQDSLSFVSPIVLNWLIAFIKNRNELWKGFLYAGILFVASTLQTLFLSQYFYQMFLVGLKIKTALICAIYRKSLKVSSFSRKNSTIGEIVNLMAVDTQKFVDLLTYLNMLWSAPYQIFVSLYLLWNVLGPSVLAGLATLIILIPINAYIVEKVKVFQVKQMDYKDERIKTTSEVLNGIKVLKLYAWEPSFLDEISKFRTKEVYELKKAAYMNAGANFIWTCAPFLVSLITFATYVLIDDNNKLDANTAFVSLTLFNLLRFPMSMLPTLIANIAQTAVSIKRINKFMNLEEVNPNNVTHESNEDSPVVIEKGSFSWGDKTVLSDVNLRLLKGSLTAIVGNVGSGKSSLLAALLGETIKKEGRVNTRGKIAYVAQQAWIQNATLRDNILFGKKYNQNFYNKVVEACALTADFETLPGGDMTEIGEKGVNLSGGQRQRINLARAIYANADIYLMDDPLSAVDSHVGKHLFENAIGPEGLLRNKTRILATHSVSILAKCDKVVVLQNGRISENGTYNELLKNQGAFADFLRQHIAKSICENGGSNLDDLADLEGFEMPEILAKKLQALIKEQAQSAPNSRMGSFRTNSIRRTYRDYPSSISSSRNSIDILDMDINAGRLIDIEKIEVGSVKFEIYKKYFVSIGLFLSFIILVLNFVFQGFNIGSSFWLSEWSNDSDGNDIDKRNMYLLVYGLLGVGQGVSSLIASFAFAKGFFNASVRAHDNLLKSCLHATQAFFDTTPIGRILNRFSNDINCVDNLLPPCVQQGITNFFMVLGTLFVVSYNSPLFLVVIFITGTVYWVIQRVYQATCRQLKRMEAVSRSPIYSYFGETISGVCYVRAYKQQERFVYEMDKRVDSNQTFYYYSLVANRWLAVRLESIANLIILFAALFAVLERDSMSPGVVGLSVSYALQITQTLNWLVRMTSDVETNIVAVERIKEYEGAPQEAEWIINEKRPPDEWPSEGAVTFDNYFVQYRPELDFVLKDVSMTIKGGERVGIVGRTGAGKSSLTLSLFRIIEASKGSISIDNIDISNIGLHDLRSKITIIPQDAVLFSGTLRSNLDPYGVKTDEELWAALDQAHLKKYFAENTDGLYFKVAEGGENFSIGQKQLICLSRALLRRTKILILDEATAAVDIETDEFIQSTIRSEFKNCTVITIAHRLNTVIDYDRIIVLDKGVIKEFDHPKKLLEEKGIFYSMCKESGLV